MRGIGLAYLAGGMACAAPPPVALPDDNPDAPMRIRVIWTAGDAIGLDRALGAALARWQRVLLRPQGAGAPPFSGSCGTSVRVTTRSDDDLTVLVVPLPGPALHVADAFSCATRSDGTTSVGVIRIDVSRLADARPMSPADLLAHELGHVLGIAPGWFGRSGMTLPSGRPPRPGDGDPRFLGPASRDAAVAVGVRDGAEGVPIETTDGAFGHWRGDALDGELMAWANRPGMRLSAVTVGALADLGYRVDRAAAEVFVAPSTLAQSLHGSPPPPRIQ